MTIVGAVLKSATIERVYQILELVGIGFNKLLFLAT